MADALRLPGAVVLPEGEDVVDLEALPEEFETVTLVAASATGALFS